MRLLVLFLKKLTRVITTRASDMKKITNDLLPNTAIKNIKKDKIISTKKCQRISPALYLKENLADMIHAIRESY